jgi:hypothetical protein
MIERRRRGAERAENTNCEESTRQCRHDEEGVEVLGSRPRLADTRSRDHLRAARGKVTSRSDQTGGTVMVSTDLKAWGRTVEESWEGRSR